jgi:hypothetical protein
MHQGETTEDGVIFDRDVAGQGSIIGKNGVTANLAIVSNVHVGHDPVVVADPGYAAILHRAATEGAVFTDHIVIAYFQGGGLAGVFFVLGITTDGSEGIDLVVATNVGGARNHCVRTNLTAGTDFYIGADDGEGSNTHVVSEPGGGVDNGLGVDHDWKTSKYRPFNSL